MAGEKMDCEMEVQLERLASLVPTVLRRLVQEADRANLPLTPSLSLAQRMVLLIVARDGRVTMSELARSLGVTMGATTTLVDRLLADGLVARTRSNRDRRVVHVEATDRGRLALMVSKKMLIKRLGRGLARLDPRDVATFVTVLEKLATAMQVEVPPVSQ